MANENDISGKVGLDITDFKANISSLNQQIKVIESGFKASAAGMADWGNNADGLQARIKSLTDIIELQRKKVDNLKEIYAKVAAEQGESSKAARDLEIRINKETAALNKNQLELDTTTEKLDNFGKEADDAEKETEQLSQAQDKAAKSSHGLGSALKDVAGVLGKGIAGAAKATVAGIAAIGTAAVATAAGLFELTKSAGAFADELITTSNQTGVSTKTLQEWEYAARFVDTEVSTMTNGLAKVTKAIGAANDQSQDYIELADGMTISIKGTNGELLSAEEVFYRSIDALGSMSNETERDIAAQQLFGKSYQDMVPLIEAGSEGLKQYADEAHKMGLVLDDEAIGALGDFDDTMQRINAQTEGLGRQLAVTFLPTVSSVMSGVQDVLGTIGGALKDGFQPEDVKSIGEAITKKLVEGIESISRYIPDIVRTLSDALTQVVSMIVTMMPRILPALMDGATQLLSGLIQAITSNLQPLIDMAVLLINKFAEFLVQSMPMIITAGVELITALSQAILENLPLLIEAALQIIVMLASGIAEALPELIPAIVDTVLTIVDTLIANVGMLVDAAIEIILALTEGIINALPQLIERVPEILIALVTAVITNLPKLLEASVQIIVALAKGLIQAIPKLLEAIPKIIAAMVTSFGKFFNKMAEVGLNLVKGLWQGIKDAASWIKNKISGFVDDVVGGIKSFFGISSPSKVMAGIGEYLSMGLAKGITDKAGLVKKAMGAISNEITGGQTLNANINGSVTDGSMGMAMAHLVINLDGRKLWEGLSPIQFSRNSSYARSLGVVIS